MNYCCLETHSLLSLNSITIGNSLMCTTTYYSLAEDQMFNSWLNIPQWGKLTCDLSPSLHIGWFLPAGIFQPGIEILGDSINFRWLQVILKGCIIHHRYMGAWPINKSHWLTEALSWGCFESWDNRLIYESSLPFLGYFDVARILNKSNPGTPAIVYQVLECWILKYVEVNQPIFGIKNYSISSDDHW